MLGQRATRQAVWLCRSYTRGCIGVRIGARSSIAWAASSTKSSRKRALVASRLSAAPDGHYVFSGLVNGTVPFVGDGALGLGAPLTGHDNAERA